MMQIHFLSEPSVVTSSDGMGLKLSLLFLHVLQIIFHEDLGEIMGAETRTTPPVPTAN